MESSAGFAFDFLQNHLFAGRGFDESIGRPGNQSGRVKGTVVVRLLPVMGSGNGIGGKSEKKTSSKGMRTLSHSVLLRVNEETMREGKPALCAIVSTALTSHPIVCHTGAGRKNECGYSRVTRQQQNIPYLSAT